MSTIDLDSYDDEFQNGGRRPRRARPNHKPKHNKWALAHSLYEPDSKGRDELVFAPSLNASSEEMVWITEHLAQFYHTKLIADVARRVKGGKEANVYCCPGHPESGRGLIAAKLYRPRKFRSLKNTTQYQQGRAMLNADGSVVGARDWRLLKAIAGKTRKGVVAAQTSWLTYEYTLMQKLHEAGADVPEPFKHNEYALLMEYIGDDSMPAPMLIDVALEPGEAVALFERAMHNVETMLACGWVHGDLSAYNMLYWEGRLVVIDFPQVVDPIANPDARAIFRRDVERVCQYFARYGVRSDPRRLANDFWSKHVAGKELAR
jgi:RIO kinase 1